MAAPMNEEAGKWNLLKIQFLSMNPLRNFDEKALLESDPEDIMSSTVLSEICQQYPVSKKYQTAFLKRFINLLEKHNVELPDTLYEYYSKLMVSPEMDQWCYKTYYVDENAIISLQESTCMVSQGTTGLCTWQAAQYLAEWCIENKSVVQNKHILELGSGLGMTGITLCKCVHPKCYTFTDCHEAVLTKLTHNVKLNLKHGFNLNLENGYSSTDDQRQTDRTFQNCGKSEGNEIQVDILSMDWYNVDELEQMKKHEVILAADVVYDPSIIPVLVRVLSKLLHQNNTTAFIASTVRNKDTNQEFCQLLGNHGLAFEEMSKVTTHIFCYDRTVPIQLLQLTVKD